MHILDGYLGPITYGGLWAAILPVWYYALRRIKETLKASEVPLLALSGAFSFVVMMFNVPVPAGTTGHATGAVLIAILLGPWPAVIAVSLSLVMQALLFGDGGITAIGANCFNIAFAETFVGYAVYRLLQGKNPTAKRGLGPLRGRTLFAAGAGSYIGLNIAALLTAFEIGIQTILHVGPEGRPLYSPFPLKVALPAIMASHVAVFGLIEAAMTVLVLSYIIKSHPDLIRNGQ